jgi:hypothetical protein
MRVEGEKRAKGTHKSDFCCSFAVTYCLVGLLCLLHLAEAPR